MRRALALAALCSWLAACGQPMRWEKAGVDETVTLKDLSSCRVAARDEAMRNYYPAPFFGPYGLRHSLLWDQRAESNRFQAEINLTNFCMRNKGYALVPIAPQTTSPEK